MRVSEARQRGACPECGASDVPLTKAGLLYKHTAGDGGTCSGSGSAPVAPDPDDDWFDDAAGDSTPDAPTPPPPPAAFSWTLTIRHALYLDDPAWHQANAQVADRAARAAGHVPTGEARCVSTTPTRDGAGLVLTYIVPISGDQRG